MTTLRYERPWLYPRQAQALFHPARYTFIEASTKSGKTVGCIVWLFEQAALDGKTGRNYWWVAPTLMIAKIAYRRMKRAIPRQLYRANDSDICLTLINGAVIWFKGADRPDTLYGEDVYAAVLDEGSRCKADAWIALRTTLTATQGAVRVIGNVKGRRNWFYRLARKAESGMRNAAYFKLTADDAIAAGIFPAEEVADAKEHMPEAAWRELYYAEATDDGSNPFGLDAIAECVGPLSAARPIAFGWDFARAQDWTVGVALDGHYQLCRWDRWQQLPWGETYKRVKQVNGDAPAWGDSTGLGDPVVEALQGQGIPIFGYRFTAPSRQLLMQRLAAVIQQRKVRYPDELPNFPIRAELEAFEYQYTPSGGVRYGVPEGYHDDCAVALALAVYARDQCGEVAQPAPPDIDPDAHPGFDYIRRKRLKPWEKALQPHDVEGSRWRPGPAVEDGTGKW